MLSEIVNFEKKSPERLSIENPTFAKTFKSESSNTSNLDHRS